MNRLTRGFHRLGLAISVPLLLIGLLLVVMEFTGLNQQSAAGSIGLICIIVGAFFYGVCRTIAWIANGFRETA